MIQTRFPFMDDEGDTKPEAVAAAKTAASADPTGPEALLATAQGLTTSVTCELDSIRTPPIEACPSPVAEEVVVEEARDTGKAVTAPGVPEASDDASFSPAALQSSADPAPATVLRLVPKEARGSASFRTPSGTSRSGAAKKTKADLLNLAPITREQACDRLAARQARLSHRYEVFAEEVYEWSKDLFIMAQTDGESDLQTAAIAKEAAAMGMLYFAVEKDHALLLARLAA